MLLFILLLLLRHLTVTPGWPENRGFGAGQGCAGRVEAPDEIPRPLGPGHGSHRLSVGWLLKQLVARPRQGWALVLQPVGVWHC